MAGSTDDAAKLAALRAACTRSITGHGLRPVAEMLATIPADTDRDTYGDGGVVTSLETEIAALLGKPAAVFLPSGTMAQQAVLRVHADQRGRRTVVFHPMCHLEQHEEQAYQRLHQLVGRPAGQVDRLMTLADLTAIAEPVAALLLELPQRDLGGQQPAWADLVAQCDWARSSGAAVHLDGARIWESAAGYGRSLADIAALFDSVYVSFYKGIGALPGCCVAGSAELVSQVRDWRRRMGGTLASLWPGAASARSCLAVRLPKMPGYLDYARAIAAALSEVPGVVVVPDPPQTPMMHLLLRTTSERFTEVAGQLATERKVWAWGESMATIDPELQRVELPVGDGTYAFSVDELTGIIAAFAAC
jgi:threonine aldolase